jgi:hypothetical protein
MSTGARKPEEDDFHKWIEDEADDLHGRLDDYVKCPFRCTGS